MTNGDIMLGLSMFALLAVLVPLVLWLSKRNNE